MVERTTETHKTEINTTHMNHYNARIAALLFAIAITASAFAGVAMVATAHTTNSITAGSTTSGPIDVTITDASSDATGQYAANIDIHNVGSQSINITQIDWQDTDSENSSYTLTTEESIAAGSNAVLSTAGGGTTADRYIGAPTVGDDDGTIVVHFSESGSSYSASIAVDLDADGDMYPNSADAYPQEAAESTQHTVNATNGIPDTAFAEFANGTGTAEFTVMKFNATSSTYEEVYSESVDMSAGTVTASYDISDAEDGTEYLIETHGTATVNERGIAYMVDTDGDGIADIDDAYPNNAIDDATYTVNTTEGSPSTAYADIAAGNGTVDVTLYKLNETSGSFELVETRTVTADSDNATLAEIDISGAEDGTQYMIETHGTATVTETGLTYDALSGVVDGDADDSPNLPENAEYALAGLAIVGAAVLLIRAGGNN